MQWDSGKNAGFSDASQTWLKVKPNYKWINVEKSKTENLSVFHFYKEMIRLRRESKFKELLVYGDFEPFEIASLFVIVYRRNMKNESLIVFINFQNKEEIVEVPAGYTEKIIGNYKDGAITEETYCLRPYECISFYGVHIR